MSRPNAVEKEGTPRPRRRVAGQDPAKREQILDGAKRCFLRLGFEAASMNEITAEAGVSKGTIYVYFANKEELFGAVVDRERARTMTAAAAELDGEGPIEDALRRFGVAVALRITSEEAIRAQRMVLGVCERMPSVARRFFGKDPLSGVAVLEPWLKRHVAAGELAIEDFDLAARQFFELSMTGIYKARLFGNIGPVSREEATRITRAAAALWLSHYGRKSS